MEAKHVRELLLDLINRLEEAHTQLGGGTEKQSSASRHWDERRLQGKKRLGFMPIDATVEKMRPGEHRNFILNCRIWLEQNEYSQNAFAMKSGISQKTVWVVVNNKNAPTLPMCIRFAEAMNVPLTKLLEDPEIPPR